MSLANWKKQFAKQTRASTLKWQIAGTRRVYKKLGRWLDIYRGGLPVGVFAAFAQYESNGRMDAPGDKYLGEIGYFQITKTLPKRFGINPELRKDPQTNVFLGGLEYNYEAARFANLYPEVIPGSKDAWLLARLAFAVGVGGTKRILNLTKRSKGLIKGNVYGSVIEYIDRVGGIDLGRGQPAGKVWFRVRMVPVAWSVGMRAIPGKPGLPRMLPTPPRVSSYYVKPESVRRRMQTAVTVNSQKKGIGLGGLLLGLGVGALVLSQMKGNE